MTDGTLHVVGIGEDGPDGLSPAARHLVESADLVAGGARHLAMLPDDGRARLEWPKPMSAAFDTLDRRSREGRVVVLASGDPLWYGAASMLIRHFGADRVHVVPAPGAFQLAAAELGWSLADLDTLTLHGRPPELLHSYIQPGARLLILSEDGHTPAKIAAMLCRRGFGPSTMTVLEHLGGDVARLIPGQADRWRPVRRADLNTVAVECAAGPDAQVLARTPGLPDDAFRHDGQLTKREVRAATLAALAPGPGQHLWDLGAGCGSVAIEWMRAARGASAAAVEPEQSRLTLIAENALALGVPGLQIVAGTAPDGLGDLHAPDAVFVGGGVSAPGVLDAGWRALQPGGRLVANAVTLEGERALMAWHAEHGGELTRLQVSRAEPIGPYHGWRPLRTVTQLKAEKPRTEASEA